MSFNGNQRRLIMAGALLFFVGLVQGGLVQEFANPRMALSAHLTAVQSGLAIMVCGIVWSAARLGAGASTFARWTIAGSMWLLWIALTVAAANGASNRLPIAGAGFDATPNGEALVSALIGISAVAMMAGWAVFLWGMMRSLSHSGD